MIFDIFHIPNELNQMKILCGFYDGGIRISIDLIDGDVGLGPVKTFESEKSYEH